MGINKFYSWLRSKYSNAFSVYPHKTEVMFDHIYIDLNYLLHMLYSEKTLKDKIKRLYDIILDICKKYTPLVSLNLFCDGVAPLAKLLLQRERRLQEARKDIDVANSSLNFTPGTQFIDTLDEKLDELKTKISDVFNISVNIINKEAGEAEIKIKDMINININKNKDSSHLLVTNDGDVVLIVTATINYHNIYILVNKDLISIKKIIDMNINYYGNSLYPQLDFSFLNLFNGNDYFPKLKYITIDKLWIAYSRKINKYKYLVKIEENKLIINKQFLIKILENLISQIDYKILKKTKFNEFNKHQLQNYLDGLNWCFNMYFNGKYCYNTYMSSRITPDPLMLTLYLYENDFSLDKYKKDNLDISKEICAILLLPKKASELIDHKYKNFIAKHNYLYEEEDCEQCIYYHKELGRLQKIYEKNEDDKKIKSLITSNQKQYTTHHKNHKKIDILDITELIEQFNLFKLSLS